jgi:hypothetical protein
MSVPERALSPELSLVDIQDDCLWSRTGDVTLLYRIEAYHEPGLDDASFNGLALLAENAWSGFPEGTSYQFFVLIDHRRGVERVCAALPPIPDTGSASRLLEELRLARLDELTRNGLPGATGHLVQERRHYLAATFAPALLRHSSLKKALRGVRKILRSAPPLGLLIPGHQSHARDGYEAVYEGVLQEAANFDRRVSVGLLQQGLGFERCLTDEIVSVVHELLNPCASETVDLRSLSARARYERDGLPRSIVEEHPFAADVSPIWSLLDDDWLVRREYLQVGSKYVAVISLKELPDRTEPGLLVPLLRLGREKYRLFYRVDVPKSGVEMAALRAKAALADGLRLENMIVQSNRSDPHADAVGKQVTAALRQIIASTQRIFGTSLQIALYEESPERLDEAVQETLGVMSRAHGLRGYRETFNLKPAYLSLLPGAPPLVERRRKALTPVMVDMMPVFDFRCGEGKVPFLTPSNSLVLYDPWDTRAQANANILVTGTSGAGKSVAVQVIVSGYEIAAAGRGEPRPYTFILDNGQSYRRWCELREDARYVPFSFQEPPGVDPFAWSEEDGPLPEHVSRLEWLLLDLMRVADTEDETFERKKSAVEEALYALYREDVLAKDFRGFAEALKRSPTGAELAQGLFPFTEGKFARLLTPNPALALGEDVRAVCYDFHGLSEHRDLAAVALRLVVYQVRRFSARMARRSHRTFLVLDESWSLLDAAAGGSSVARTAAPFIAASVRMGRKEGMSVIGLSQQIEDFAQSAYGAAIIGNSSTKLVGFPGGEGVEALRRHLRLTDRQVEQVRRLTRTDRYHEFLLVHGETTHVVRVALDPLSRWIFTTSPADRERLAALEEARPELTLLDRIRLLAQEGERC